MLNESQNAMLGLMSWIDHLSLGMVLVWTLLIVMAVAGTIMVVLGMFVSDATMLPAVVIMTIIIIVIFVIVGIEMAAGPTNRERQKTQFKTVSSAMFGSMLLG